MSTTTNIQYCGLAVIRKSIRIKMDLPTLALPTRVPAQLVRVRRHQGSVMSINLVMINSQTTPHNKPTETGMDMGTIPTDRWRMHFLISPVNGMIRMRMDMEIMERVSMQIPAPMNGGILVKIGLGARISMGMVGPILGR